MSNVWMMVLLLSALALVATEAVCAAPAPLDPARIKALAAMLPEHPTGVGVPASDRAAWARVATRPAWQGVVARAEQVLKTPWPEQPDDLYLEFSRNGNRTRWQNVAFERRSRLGLYALAEALEGKGRFVPALEQALQAVSAERTWVMPAHDAKLTNFEGKVVDIDLFSAHTGWCFGTVDQLLQGQLSPATRQLIRAQTMRRIIEPARAMVKGERPVNWWFLTTSNWNAVCVAGVTGTALATLDSREDRAFFVAAAEYYIRNFLKGFTADGYCSEGVGYWDYGFGHFVLLSETVRAATGGGLDLMALPEAKMPALFGERIQIINGVCPAFADCGVNARPSEAIRALVARRYQLAGAPAEVPVYAGPGSAYEPLIGTFINPSAPELPRVMDLGVGLRSWFQQAGILIGRPQPNSPCQLAVALKGGHNAEHHNHNDVGSYVVVSGDRPVLLDPGSEEYTARTFSARRYESKVLNSYGHPVPVVAGVLQKEGRQSEGKVLKTEFSDERDLYRLDLASAYPVPELKSLVRTFTYSRAGAGGLTVTDEVEFSAAKTFGTALVTMGSWRQTGPSTLMVWATDQALQVDYEATGGTLKLTAEVLHEKVHARTLPTRLGLDFVEPVTKASITVRIKPLAIPGAGLVKNGDFELGDYGWDIPADGFAELTEEQAASGQRSLKITDGSTKSGSNVSSGVFALPKPGKYELRGKVRLASGGGVGMYVRYLDGDRKVIGPYERPGWLTALGTATGPKDQWTPFAWRFEPMPGTAYLQVWIHSANAAETVAYLDDIAVVAVE